MSVARRLCVIGFSLATLTAGCSKKNTPPAESPPATTPVAAAKEPARADTVAVERYRITGSIAQVDDMLAAAHDMARWMSDDEPMDPNAQIQAILLGTGFAPGFFDSLDLAGIHLVEALYPHESERARPEQIELAARVAVVDARTLIEGMPQSMRPQPLGGGLWELILQQGDGGDAGLEPQRVLLREQAQAVEIGFDVEDLDRAGGLKPLPPEGRRIRVHVDNLPQDRIDPSGLLGLDPDSPLGQRLGKALKNTRSLGGEIDFGTQRDLQLLVTAEAPFDSLGLDPLGPPLMEASAIERRLPAKPVLAAALSWGDPALLHQVLDRDLPIAQIPEPFGTPIRAALAHVHTLLDQVVDATVVALYLGQRDDATLVFASKVRDANAARAALRGLHVGMNDAATAHRKLTGGAKDSEIKVEWKPDAIKVAGGPGDLLSITVPPNLRSDARSFSMFLDNARLDLVTWVHGDVAVWAMGKGAKALVAQLARTGEGSSEGLAGNDGLRLIRTAMGGCQLCISAEPLGALRLRWLVEAADADGQKQKKARRALSSLEKIELPGGTGFGINVRPDQASLALVASQKILFASPETVAAVREILKELDDPPPTPKPVSPNGPAEES